MSELHVSFHFMHEVMESGTHNADSSEQDVTKLDRTDWRDFTTKVMHIQRTQENSTYEETKWSHKAIWIKPAVSHVIDFKIQGMGPRMTSMHA